MALHSFSRGDVIWCEFPPNPEEPDFVITGKHMAIILSDDMLPNRTVIVSPISSWIKKKDGKLFIDDEGKPVYKKIEEFNYGIYKTHYDFLKHDSYIKLDQIITLTRETIEGEIVGRLSPDHLFQVDLRLIIVLNMFDSIKRLIETKIGQKASSEI